VTIFIVKLESAVDMSKRPRTDSFLGWNRHIGVKLSARWIIEDGN